MLMDQSRPVPTYLDRWHLFLPSEVSLACTIHVLLFHVVFPKRLLLQKMCLVRKPAFVQEFGFVRVLPAMFGWFRIHSMYCYDVNLFRDRWLGPPGVPRLFFFMRVICTN